MDCSPPGSSIHRILLARILEWIAIHFSRRSSGSWEWSSVSCIVRRFLTIWPSYVSFFREGNGTPLQYSCLENHMGRGAWPATVHGVTRVGHDWATNHHQHHVLPHVCTAPIKTFSPHGSLRKTPVVLFTVYKRENWVLEKLRLNNLSKFMQAVNVHVSLSYILVKNLFLNST